MKIFGVYQGIDGVIKSFPLGSHTSFKVGREMYLRLFLQTLQAQRNQVKISFLGQSIERACFFNTVYSPFDVCPLVVVKESDVEKVNEDTFGDYVIETEEKCSLLLREVFPFTETGLELQKLLKEFNYLDYEAMGFLLNNQTQDPKYLFLKERMTVLQDRIEKIQIQGKALF